jgi:hypothetical protein
VDDDKKQQEKTKKQKNKKQKTKNKKQKTKMRMLSKNIMFEKNEDVVEKYNV